MKIKVKLHGPIKKAIGKDAVQIDLAPGGTLQDLLTRVIDDYPEMGYRDAGELTGSYMLLAGSQIVKPDFKLIEDGEVIIFPFVDGG